MTEIPGTQWAADFDVSDALQQAPLQISYRKLMQTVEHVFTHFALTLFVFVAEVPQKTKAPEDCRWASGEALDDEAFPSLMRKVVSLARQNGV
jgi:A/G-specific adenine glycosylase